MAHPARGLHTCYNGAYKESDLARASGPHKSARRSQIESATRLHEVGIANVVDQNATVRNTFPGLVHRPSHHGE